MGGLGNFSALLFGGSAMAAVAEMVGAGPDLAGIAAVIAASAGMVSAVGAIIIALRRKPEAPVDNTLRDQMLLELLRDKLEEKEAGDDNR